MKIEALLLKLLRSKFKLFKDIPIEYNVEDAIKIINDEEYEDIDLFIWIDEENDERPTFFENKNDALEYINEMNPQTVFIEFSDAVLINKVSDDLIDYIRNTDELTDELKIKLIRILIDNYIKDNNDIITEDFKEDIDYIQELPDNELLEYIKNDDDFFYDVIVNFSWSIDIESSVLSILPNENFYKTNNIRFINEICKDMLINFHNYNFKNGFLNEESIKLICDFLHSKFSLNEEYYKYYFGNYNIDQKTLNNILILTTISDYYRFVYSNKDDNKFLGENDKNYLKLIQKSNIQRLLLEFEFNEEFAKTVVGDFIFYNEYYIKNEIDDQKTLKKVDPFYKLNNIIR